jgi:hypothetical protein
MARQSLLVIAIYNAVRLTGLLAAGEAHAPRKAQSTDAGTSHSQDEHSGGSEKTRVGGRAKNSVTSARHAEDQVDQGSRQQGLAQGTGSDLDTQRIRLIQKVGSENGGFVDEEISLKA